MIHDALTVAALVAVNTLLVITAFILVRSIVHPATDFDQRASRFKVGSGAAVAALAFAVPTGYWLAVAVALALIVGHMIRHETDTKNGF